MVVDDMEEVDEFARAVIVLLKAHERTRDARLDWLIKESAVADA